VNTLAPSSVRSYPSWRWLPSGLPCLASPVDWCGDVSPITTGVRGQPTPHPAGFGSAVVSHREYATAGAQTIRVRRTAPRDIPRHWDGGLRGRAELSWRPSKLLASPSELVASTQRARSVTQRARSVARELTLRGRRPYTAESRQRTTHPPARNMREVLRRGRTSHLDEGVRPISVPRSTGDTPVRYAGRLDRKPDT
jgi:hypothetical protein